MLLATPENWEPRAKGFDLRVIETAIELGPRGEHLLVGLETVVVAIVELCPGFELVW